MDKFSFEKKHPTIFAANLSVLTLVVLTNILGVILGFVIAGLSILSGNPLNEQALSSFAFNMAAVALTQLLCILPISLVYLKSTKRDLATTLRLKKGIDLVQVVLLAGISLGCIYVANPLNDLFMLLLETLGYTPSAMTFSITSLPQVMIALPLVAILPAICEELLFRGVVLRGYERYSPAAAVIMSALLFGFMHSSLEQLVATTIIGIILAIVVMVTDSLWASIVIHFINNAFALIYNFIFADAVFAEYTPLERVVSDFSSLIFFAPLLIIALALFVFYTKRRNKKRYGEPYSPELKSGYAKENTIETDPQTGVIYNVSPAGKNPFIAYLPMVIFFIIVFGTYIVTFFGSIILQGSIING